MDLSWFKNNFQLLLNRKFEDYFISDVKPEFMKGLFFVVACSIDNDFSLTNIIFESI